jgi:hypothetical protein
MQFALAISLVLFVSTALLLYQFLTGSLIGADDRAATSSWPARRQPRIAAELRNEARASAAAPAAPRIRTDLPTAA